jgi:hypothetical protein
LTRARGWPTTIETSSGGFPPPSLGLGLLGVSPSAGCAPDVISELCQCRGGTGAVADQRERSWGCLYPGSLPGPRFQSATSISYRSVKLPRVCAGFRLLCLRHGADLPQVRRQASPHRASLWGLVSNRPAHACYAALNSGPGKGHRPETKRSLGFVCAVCAVALASCVSPDELRRRDEATCNGRFRTRH